MKTDLVVCGGGTGGHFFSGIALAEKFLSFSPTSRVCFIGTRYGIEGRYTLTDPRMRIRYILSRGVKGRGVFHKMVALALMAVGFFQSILFLLRVRPKWVFGVGGYASAPTLAAAVVLRPLLRFKIGVLEQNSFAGLANRIFSKVANLSISAFPVPGFKTADLPLRSSTELKSVNVRSAEWPPRVIFVLGGSQGARGLNQRWRELLPKLAEEYSNLKIYHQTGSSDFENMKSLYQELGMNAEVFPFSDDMPKLYGEADLMVCRSGAMTVFEVMAFQRPCVFVPFPFAADDHQTKNALAVQDAEFVVAESSLNWDRLKRILRSPAPPIPARKHPAEVQWRDVFLAE